MPAPTSRTRPAGSSVGGHSGSRPPDSTSSTWASGAVTGEPAQPDPAADGGPRRLELPRWVLASVAAAGLAVLVLATTSDRVPLVHVPATPVPGLPPGPLQTPTVTASAATASATTPPIVPFDLPWVRPLVLAVLIVGGAVMVAGTAWALVEVARRLWQDRWRTPDVLHALESERVDVPLATSRDALAEAAASMRKALRTGSPRNAVVQCWLLFVAALERRGVHPDPAMSPTELTRHALSQVSTDRAAVAELTSLFLEARFSEHEIGEDARRRAEGALERVTAALVPTSPAGPDAEPTGRGPR